MEIIYKYFPPPDFFDISPITSSDDARMFNPGSITNVQLDREWLLGQIRVRCCHPDNLSAKANIKNGQVCAQMLSSLDNSEEILEIMNLKDFSLSILSSCLAYEAKEKKYLYQVSRKILLNHIKTLIQTLPNQIGFFRPYSWEMSNSDSRYCQWLESTFNENEFSRNLSYLMKAVHTAMEIKALEETEEEEIEYLSR